MITQKTIQEIMDVAKVEDIIGDFVNLKRRGVNMIGLCPFHNEKTPSFIVSPAKNIYKCFGCGKGGDPVRFLMEQENYSYPEALKNLASRYGIEVEEIQVSQESIEERKALDDLFALNQYAYEYFIDQMFNTDMGKSIGLGYFKERGFREETIKKWGLGYAPDKKNDFTLAAINDGYQEEQLKSIGLSTQYSSDFYRGRVMFPIRNLSGKIIGFGGRILAKGAKAAKYLNSPDSDIYNKSKVLYGAHFARTAIRKQDECIMVEGYTDTLSLHQAGIENVVAPCGTSLTSGQIRVIKRYTPNITFIFDGDAAGKKAALRGLDMVLEQDMNVKLVLLPDGEDPDSLLQSLGVVKFEEFVERNKKDFILFKTEHLMEEAKDDPTKKAAMIKEIIASIAKIPDPIKRSVFVKECSSITSTQEQLLFNEINKHLHVELKKRREKKSRTTSNEEAPFPPEENFPTLENGEAPPLPVIQEKPKSSGDEFQEKDLVRLLVEAGTIVMIEEEGITVSQFILNNIEELLNDFDSEIYADVVRECLDKFNQGEILSSNYFLHHKDKKIRDLALGFMASPFEYSPNWEEIHGLTLQTQKAPEENFLNDTLSSVNRFKLRKVLKLLKKNQDKLQSTTDSSETIKTLKVQQRLTEMKKELAAFFGSVIVK